MIPPLKLLAIAATATLLVTMVLQTLGQEPSANKKAYVRTGQEATLSGTVTFTGKPPKPLKIDMSADPVCVKLNPHPQLEWFAINNESLANVLVYATSNSILDNYWFEPPNSVVVMEHKGCQYEPRVLGIQAGQSLSLINSDATQHNTHPVPKNNAEWNMSQAIGGTPIVKTFQRAELLIPFKDNQHPWEKAYVSVFSHPFFAVSDANGNYKIEGLPPGSYKITAWHEKLGEQSVDVVFVPGESRFVGFAFAAADLKGFK
ncbi:MAG: carboxypeptidase regulatory-like domain-containing protein [Acidobacteriota bacterium]